MSRPVSVRGARVDDLDAVALLDRLAFGEEAWGEDALRGEDGGAARGLVVAERDGAVLGYAVLLVAGDVADLLRIAVAADARRTGVASALIGAARERARDEGADRLLLEVAHRNTGALACYRAAGGEVIDTRSRYYRDGDDAHVVRLPLAPATAAHEAQGASADTVGPDANV